MKKRLLSALLALCLVLALLPAAAFAANTSGKCGKDLTWSLSNGVLTIEGTGPMQHYYRQIGLDGYATTPWYDFREEIHTVRIGDGVTSIGNDAFCFCANLTDVTIPDGVTFIGIEAFYGCTSLQSVTIPQSVTSIGGSAFFDCVNLTCVVIPDGVTTIGNGAFSRCSALTSVTISASVTSIGDWAFSGCSALTSVTIPASVTSIGDGTFSGCTGLTDVYILGALAQKTSTFPNTAVVHYFEHYFEINDGVLVKYYGPGGDVVIPDGVTTIDTRTFWKRDDLTSVTIPASVTIIRGWAFSSCRNLASVTFSGSTINIEDSAFWDCTIEEFINCPDEEFNARQTAAKAIMSGWCNPGRFISTQSERITAQANEITAGLTSDYEKAEAIAAWVSENIKYDFDYFYHRKNTVVTSSWGVLDSRLTVCEGYANLTQALLNAAGIPVRIITGFGYGLSRTGSGSAWGGHAWNLAFVDGRWIWLDTTWGTEYFDCGTAVIALKHNATGNYSAHADDTPSDWAQDEVWEAICKGLALNDLQADYRDDMTREEFCRLMVRLLERSTGQNIDAYLASKGLTAQEPFTDTDSADVAAAYVLGIVDGTSKTTFKPGGSITRQEAATMLARTAKILGLTAGDSKSFADERQFASWASESIAFVSSLTDPATGVKVMDGTGNGKFSPSAIFSREQGILTALRLFHCAA